MYPSNRLQSSPKTKLKFTLFYVKLNNIIHEKNSESYGLVVWKSWIFSFPQEKTEEKD